MMLKHCAKNQCLSDVSTWLQLAGEVDKFIITWCEIFSGLRVPKVITISSFLTYLTNKR